MRGQFATHTKARSFKGKADRMNGIYRIRKSRRGLGSPRQLLSLGLGVFVVKPHHGGTERRDLGKGHPVARVSKPACRLPIQRARHFDTRPIWKSAIQQTWKSALRPNKKPRWRTSGVCEKLWLSWITSCGGSATSRHHRARPKPASWVPEPGSERSSSPQGR